MSFKVKIATLFLAQ